MFEKKKKLSKRERDKKDKHTYYAITINTLF